jgi:hypothetical protein
MEKRYKILLAEDEAKLAKAIQEELIQGLVMKLM